VPRLLAGDEVLFASIVRGWRSGLLRLAEAITGNAASAEDVLQETWVSVMRSLVTFEGRSSLRTWVHRVCAHVALARIRQDERAPLLSDPVVDPARFDAGGAWRDPPGGWTGEPPEALACPRLAVERMPPARERHYPLQ